MENIIINGGTARTDDGFVGRVVSNFITPIDREHIVMFPDGVWFHAERVTMTGDRECFQPYTRETTDKINEWKWHN